MARSPRRSATTITNPQIRSPQRVRLLTPTPARSARSAREQRQVERREQRHARQWARRQRHKQRDIAPPNAWSALLTTLCVFFLGAVLLGASALLAFLSGEYATADLAAAGALGCGAFFMLTCLLLSHQSARARAWWQWKAWRDAQDAQDEQGDEQDEQDALMGLEDWE